MRIIVSDLPLEGKVFNDIDLVKKAEKKRPILEDGTIAKIGDALDEPRDSEEYDSDISGTLDVSDKTSNGLEI